MPSLVKQVSIAKENILAELRGEWVARDQTDSNFLCFRCVDHFLRGEPAPGIAWEAGVYGPLMKTIGTVDVNGVAARYGCSVELPGLTLAAAGSVEGCRYRNGLVNRPLSLILVCSLCRRSPTPQNTTDRSLPRLSAGSLGGRIPWFLQHVPLLVDSLASCRGWETIYRSLRLRRLSAGLLTKETTMNPHVALPKSGRCRVGKSCCP